MKKKSRNIKLLLEEDLKNENRFSEFEYKEYFDYICDLVPNVEKEKIEIENVVDEYNITTPGLVYVFVIEDKILKIGHTITPMKKRVASYNCGKTEYRINGTCSTTNWFILQSILKINKTVNVYAYFTPNPEYEVLGQQFKNSIPSSKQAEKTILETMDNKPIGNTQT